MYKSSLLSQMISNLMNIQELLDYKLAVLYIFELSLVENYSILVGEHLRVPRG